MTKNKYISVQRMAIIIMAILVLTLYSYISNHKINNYFAQSSQIEGPILRKLPIFDFIDVKTGADIKHADLLENPGPYIVHFWGTWCAPCEVELPSFNRFINNLKKEFPHYKVIVMATKDGMEQVKRHVAKKHQGLSWPEDVYMGLDSTGIVLKQFGSVKVPETFLFDRNGLLKKKFIGPQNWDSVQYLSYLRNLKL